ncbi:MULTISPECIES: spore coat protein U domain-containing protein [unclassified Deinococcus]|uniref:spore coat protein U domain-containing protein n=1 Tax=unclassified Deinococcus TaxID=2623546 RepID=UPI001E5A0827|nr:MULTISPECIES: spore coat protein U domain-containing protein [unclassified Deinococcus]MCD0157903.1 spore coat protein U domain-containing protein [Deinococcus sp. 6GRE01]MCD0161682.1 spore coat protein U domain-containing protein [Deinococcus sp. 6YEL10]
MYRYVSRTLAFSVLLGGAGQAQVQPLAITAQTINACSITTQNLDFGTYRAADPSDLRASGTFSMTCNPGVTAQLQFTGYTAKLRQGSDILDYRLTFVRPNGSSVTPAEVPAGGYPGIVTSAIQFNGTAQVYQVNGRIPARQWNSPAGTYQETVTLTLEY